MNAKIRKQAYIGFSKFKQGSLKMGTGGPD